MYQRPLIGPFPVSIKRRQHRGRIYLSMDVLLGGLCGLYMSAFAFGGMAAKLGFACLALAWFHTGMRAFLGIRQEHVAEHRKWRVCHFPLAFAAVTLPSLLPSAIVEGISFATFYPLIASGCAGFRTFVIAAALLFNRALGISLA